MRATEESKVELFPLYIHSYGDNNFRVIRKWGRSVMVTRQQGLEVIELLGRGAKLKEVRTSLAQKYGCESSKIDLSPLLTALRKANLIKSVDGEKICKNEVTASTFLEFFLRFYLFRTVNKYSRKYLPISILRKVLYLITFFQLRKATREKVENAAKNMMVVLGRDSDRKIGSYRKDYYRHLVKNIIDIDSLMPKSPTEVEAWLSNNVSYVGLEHLDRAIKSGKGVLLCGFHFTSVRLIPLVLMRRGYSFTTMGAINLHLGHDAVFRKVDDLKTSLNSYGDVDFVDNIDLKSLSKLINSLKTGGTVISYPDVYSISLSQDEETEKRAKFFGVSRAGSQFNRSKIEIDLFDHQVEMNEWLGWLHSMTGATVLPMALVRKGGRFELIVEPPIELDESSLLDKTKKKDLINREAFKVMQHYIADYPSQWFGWHNLHKLGLKPKSQNSK